MKKLNFIFTVIIGLFISVNVNAQTKPDYYPGKWNILVMGTPNGDSKMTFILERKDGDAFLGRGSRPASVRQK